MAATERNRWYREREEPAPGPSTRHRCLVHQHDGRRHQLRSSLWASRAAGKLAARSRRLRRPQLGASMRPDQLAPHSPASPYLGRTRHVPGGAWPAPGTRHRPDAALTGFRMPRTRSDDISESGWPPATAHALTSHDQRPGIVEQPETGSRAPVILRQVAASPVVGQLQFHRCASRRLMSGTGPQCPDQDHLMSAGPVVKGRKTTPDLPSDSRSAGFQHFMLNRARQPASRAARVAQGNGHDSSRLDRLRRAEPSSSRCIGRSS
jgi:hypothetical protein